MKVAMSRHFGPNDICLGAWQEIMKTRSLPNRQYVFDSFNMRAIDRLVRDAIFRQDFAYFWQMNKAKYKSRLGRASSHPDAKRIKEYFPREWEGYFKYTIVRNPFAVAASSWRQRVANRDGYLSFPEYMRAWQQSMISGDNKFHSTNWDLVSVDDRLEVDMVLRHENLENDLLRLTRQLGLPIDLPHVNAKGKPTSYRDHYCRETRSIAESMFERELSAFNYEY